MMWRRRNTPRAPTGSQYGSATSLTNMTPPRVSEAHDNDAEDGAGPPLEGQDEEQGILPDGQPGDAILTVGQKDPGGTDANAAKGEEKDNAETKRKSRRAWLSQGSHYDIRSWH